MSNWDWTLGLILEVNSKLGWDIRNINDTINTVVEVEFERDRYEDKFEKQELRRVAASKIEDYLRYL